MSYAQAGQVYPRGRTLFAVVGTFVGVFLALFLFISFLRPFLPSPRRLPFIGEADTLIFSDAEIEKVWLWEIASGRYPSKRKTDFPLGEDAMARVYRAGSVTGPTLQNPGVPKLGLQEMKDSLFQQSRKQSTSGVRQPLVVLPQPDPTLAPVGLPRQTLAILPRPIYSPKYDAPSTFPPRPVPNSAIDLDTVMDYCDFSTGKYVRDCLEVLRMNAGMDSGVRRGNADSWRAHFVVPAGAVSDIGSPSFGSMDFQSTDMTAILNSTGLTSLLTARQQLTLTPTSDRFLPHASHPSADPACNPDYPRIFHIFWAGPFTDKPYSAALSFLYTQRLALHQPLSFAHGETNICRPQLWIWINPGPASSLPDPNARRTMYKELGENPWSGPLLHPRFEESIKFKLWNTTEQLDAVSEMEGWREMRLFNSGGVKYGAAGEVSLVEFKSR